MSEQLQTAGRDAEFKLEITAQEGSEFATPYSFIASRFKHAQSVCFWTVHQCYAPCIVGIVLVPRGLGLGKSTGNVRSSNTSIHNPSESSATCLHHHTRLLVANCDLQLRVSDVLRNFKSIGFTSQCLSSTNSAKTRKYLRRRVPWNSPTFRHIHAISMPMGINFKTKGRTIVTCARYVYCLRLFAVDSIAFIQNTSTSFFVGLRRAPEVR